MYSRSYNEESPIPQSHSRLPHGYDGTALIDPPYKKKPIEECCAPKEIDDECLCEEKRRKPQSLFDNILGIFGGGKFSFADIGIEDICLIGLAMFLFFSKNKDRECAFMVAALLLIR